MLSQLKTIHVGLILAAASIFVTAGIISAQQPTEEDAVRATANQLIASMNAEDVEAAIKDLSSDVFIEGFGFCPEDGCEGIASIRTALETAADENVRLRVVPGMERVHGQIWIAEVEVRADSISKAGTSRLLYQLEIEVEDGKVTRLRFTPELDDAQTASFIGTGTPASVGNGLGQPLVTPPSTGSGGLLSK